MTTWISTTEQFPPDYQQVLLCYLLDPDTSTMLIGYRENDAWHKSDIFNGYNLDKYQKCVTHWMPLPNPPERLKK